MPIVLVYKNYDKKEMHVRRPQTTRDISIEQYIISDIIIVPPFFIEYSTLQS
jgi:hypothetical protein